MLNLNNLRSLLLQVITPPSLHTAVLFTPEGQLVSYAAGPSTSKDEIRVIVGLSSEIWQETKEQGIGMVDSELGRLLVLPVEKRTEYEGSDGKEKEDEPLMLVTLHAEDSVSWQELEDKARALATHLEVPVAKLRGRLATAPTSPINLRPERPAR